MAEDDDVGAFLHKIKTLDTDIFYYQKDTILSSPLVRNGMYDRFEALRISEARIGSNNGRAPFQGLNVGDVKNVSHDDLDKIANNFSGFIGELDVAYCSVGFMDDGKQVQEVTVKTWDFVFPSVGGYANYP